MPCTTHHTAGPYLGDPSLHDQEVRVVHIQLNRSEEVLDTVVLDIAAIDEVLVLAADDDLPGDGDLVIVLISERRPGGILRYFSVPSNVGLTVSCLGCQM